MDKPILTQSINVLPDETIELLHEYTSAHLRGDLEAMEKALAALEAPRKEKAQNREAKQVLLPKNQRKATSHSHLKPGN